MVVTEMLIWRSQSLISSPPPSAPPQPLLRCDLHRCSVACCDHRCSIAAPVGDDDSGAGGRVSSDRFQFRLSAPFPNRSFFPTYTKKYVK
ncbi:hypothetical protein E3N88_01357 [Mikania micrantha]|uniref:Uncharacterized protein n=1 Tax=Mikania micrantha TaxID=192012 RepID=A0A5N6Q2N1_9ASTR|nr:hypothetical protein E3N88_01357 [Mikania micrantha]